MSGGTQAVLFDLDGTLIDSAPDLAHAANLLRADHGLPPLPYPKLRPVASSGARGMLRVAFDRRPGDADYERLRSDFLDHYATVLLRETAAFDTVERMLRGLDDTGLRWGIVTNKTMVLTRPIAEGLGLWSRAAVVVAGDSTPHIKPHPAPLLEAATRMGVAPAACIYIGDDLRDIQAARAAGMAGLAAGWGYLGEGEDAARWGADAVLQQPMDLLNWLAMA